MTFGPLEIRFDDRVLRPRAWTLEQTRWAAELSDDVPDGGAVAELCAGVGHIGLALAAAVPRDLVLVDADPRACELARANAGAAGLTDRVDVRTAEMDAALRPEERFALMLADPPWVRSDGTDEFPDDPVGAIDGGDDGLDLARTCLRVIASTSFPVGSPSSSSVTATRRRRSPTTSNVIPISVCGSPTCATPTPTACWCC
jgi:methylase of polypeptide subunit release factors